MLVALNGKIGLMVLSVSTTIYMNLIRMIIRYTLLYKESVSCDYLVL